MLLWGQRRWMQEDSHRGGAAVLQGSEHHRPQHKSLVGRPVASAWLTADSGVALPTTLPSQTQVLLTPGPGPWETLQGHRPSRGWGGRDKGKEKHMTSWTEGGRTPKKNSKRVLQIILNRVTSFKPQMWNQSQR